MLHWCLIQVKNGLITAASIYRWHSSIEFLNFSSSISWIISLIPDASLGLNHLLPNWKYVNTSLTKKLMHYKSGKKMEDSIIGKGINTFVRSSFLSLSLNSMMNRSIKKSTNNPQSKSFLCCGTCQRATEGGRD